MQTRASGGDRVSQLGLSQEAGSLQHPKAWPSLYLFISACAGSSLPRRLSLAAESEGCSLVAVRRLPSAIASLVAWHSIPGEGFSSCSCLAVAHSQAVTVMPWLSCCKSCGVRGRTCVFCVSGWILHHWATRQAWKPGLYGPPGTSQACCSSLGGATTPWHVDSYLPAIQDVLLVGGFSFYSLPTTLVTEPKTPLAHWLTTPYC